LMTVGPSGLPVIPSYQRSNNVCVIPLNLYADKAKVWLSFLLHIRERNIKENRFRFSLKRFWRLARRCLTLAAEGAKN